MDHSVSRLTAVDVGLVVVRGASVRVVGYGVGLGLTAVGSVVLLRYLSVADFGRYMTVVSLIAIVSSVSEAGLSSVGARELALRSRAEDRRRLLGHLLGVRLGLTTAGVVGAVVFALAVGYEDDLVLGTALYGLGILFTNAQLTMTLPLATELRIGRQTASEVVKQALTVAGIVVLVALAAPLISFFAVQIAVGVALLSMTPWLVGRAIVVWRPTFDRTDWSALLRLAAPMAVSSTVSVVFFRLLVLLMSVLSTPVETGLFATSHRVVELLYGLGAVSAAVALPVLAASAHDSRRLQYMTQRMTEVAVLAGLYLAIVTFAVAAPILRLLGGQEYEAAAPVLRIEIFALIPVFLAQVWLMGLIALGRLAALAVASAVGAVAAATLALVLIDAHAARGAAIAAVTGEAVIAVVLLVFLSVSRPGNLLSLRFVWKPALAGLTMLLVVTVVDLGAWFDAALGSVVFAVVVVTTRAVPRELLDAIRRPRPGAGPPEPT
jgi:O-antigen/teichoic acid export membrane protein